MQKNNHALSIELLSITKFKGLFKWASWRFFENICVSNIGLCWFNHREKNMSKDTELALIKLKNQQQENIKRLDGVIDEASRRYHNNDDVQISLKTLMGAIEVLKDEQKRLIDTQINLSKNIAEQVEEAIEKLNAEKIERLLYSHVSKIEQKSYNLELACDEKIDEIKSINIFLNRKILRVLMSLSVFIGGVGGMLYFFKFVNEVMKEGIKFY
jgi:hypothetical protein